MTDNLKQFIILVKNNGNRIGEVLSSDEPYIQNRYLMPKFQEVFKNKNSKKDKLPKQHYHNQNEVLLNQSLQTGKNIIYEIINTFNSFKL